LWNWKQKNNLNISLSKNKMKNILSVIQFSKWEMMKEKNRERTGEEKAKRKEHKRD
jgi:hypothetical protein